MYDCFIYFVKYLIMIATGFAQYGHNRFASINFCKHGRIVIKQVNVEQRTETCVTLLKRKLF